VRSRIVREIRFDQQIAPIEVREVDGGTQLGEIAVACFERREADSFERLGRSGRSE
jgi:hypothetical protein